MREYVRASGDSLELEIVSQRWQNVRDEVARLAEQRKGVPYFGSFWEAFNEGLETDPQLVDSTFELVKELHELNPEVNGDQAFNDAYIIHKSIQKEEVKRSPIYPVGRKLKWGWQPTFKRLANDPHYLEDIKFNLRLPIGSTVPDRFVLFRFALAAAGVRGPLNLVEYGCGLNINLAKWDMVELGQHELTYPNFNVIRPQENSDKEEESSARESFIEDRTDSNIFNGLVSGKTLGIKLGVGLDFMDAQRDKEFRIWGESNSRRPADYLNPDFNREQSILLNYNNHPDSIKFFFGGYDIPLDLASLKEKAGTNQFHAVLVSNTFYQNSQAGIQVAIANAGVLAPRGLIAVFESRKFTSTIKGSDNKPLFPQFTDAHPELDYSLFVKDMRRPRAGFMQCLLVNDPRPGEVMVLPPTADLALL
ncbi:MAG TPA: hypothetical protein VH234_04865 [Candidatus Saccharimonadales bacterium]|jgi:hypothetical protein|nr:hypothetical protein [Candidatus Saccharimonadales bacterium]